jgi:hypothetical protein
LDSLTAHWAKLKTVDDSLLADFDGEVHTVGASEVRQMERAYAITDLPRKLIQNIVLDF